MQDAHLLKLLLTVLKGDFSIGTARELPDLSTQTYVRDGLCAVAAAAKKLLLSPSRTGLRSLLAVARHRPLIPTTTGWLGAACPPRLPINRQWFAPSASSCRG